MSEDEHAVVTAVLTAALEQMRRDDQALPWGNPMRTAAINDVEWMLDHLDVTEALVAHVWSKDVDY